MDGNSKTTCPGCGATYAPALYTAQEVALLLGRDARSVTRRARVNQIGTRLRRDWVFTGQDVDAMAALPGPGRPKVLKEVTDANDRLPG